MNSEKSHGKIYGIAGDEVSSELDFIKVCGEVSSHDPQIHLIEDLGYNSVQLVHPWAKDDLVIDSTKVKTDLALSFTSLKKALDITCKWLTHHPEHFGKPSLRGQCYVLIGRPIPEYVEIGWKIVDRVTYILRLSKQFYRIGKTRFLALWRLIKK
ncbi:MAG: hypothetical protein F3745_03485 [Nitrospinae bacterium]|nr:hypothetical protein [Nitrospinota bacterium]